MGGRGVPISPEQEAEQHTASTQSQVGEASSPNTPAWGTVDPATGKLWIRPVGTTEFEPRKTVKSFIREQMFRNFNHPWATWTEIPQEHRDAWFDEFLRQFSWRLKAVASDGLTLSPSNSRTTITS
ncbi:hypothetical protein K1719_021007 [Acacia pycnantha]|nr:hypothetical protein K1719_021007 [Acacia pycnantha]